MMARTATSIAEVVRNGLCIGCGLCEAVTGGRIRMKMTGSGSLRPTPADGFSQQEEAQLLSACPGVAVEPRHKQAANRDLVWGAFAAMRYAWAGDSQVRFRAATGGVLTALGTHLLESRQVSFVLQVMADPDRALHSRWMINESPEAVIASAGSRYAPAAPLAGLMAALDRKQPFAVIAKPCDLSALHRLSRSDPRLDELCTLRLAMVCGGQSRLKKSQDLLAELGVAEDEVTLFRHRGFGNPGPTRVETSDGRAFEKTYQELWGDEAGWQLETRCKLCPDALGESADVAVADVWPGGSPAGEDAGFSGIVVRSDAGQALVAAAAKAGKLVLGDDITPRQFDGFQPHQVRKKEALTARFAGLEQAGMPTIEALDLRIAELGERLDPEARGKEVEGSLSRARTGRFSEPLPAAADEG